MWSKITTMFSSIRFWQLVIAAVIAILADYAIIPLELSQVIITLLGASVLVRTVDKLK